MKKLKTILLTCIVIILNVGISYGATNTYEIKMEPSKTEIYTGDTIKIPVKVEDIQIKDGIVAFSTLLSYNENIFEIPEISGGTDWERPNVVENLIQSTTKTMQPTKEDQEIMEISFKVKENAPLGETNIALLKFEVSDGENTIVSDEVGVHMNITSTQKKVTDVVVKSIWFTQRNIAIASIISIVTLFIIVLLTVYYIQHREKKEKSNILYEEVEGILEEESNNPEQDKNKEEENIDSEEDTEEKDTDSEDDSREKEE